MNDSSDRSNPFKITTIIMTGIVIVQFVVIAMLASSRTGNVAVPENASSEQTGSLNLEIPDSTFDVTPTVAPISEKHDLGESFFIPINANGEKLGEVEYLVREYEFTNKVVVNGIYNALLKEDRELLVLHLELTNDTNRPMELMSADSVRLIKSGSDNMIAPDISDDPVKLRPKSTVETTVGFTLDKDGEVITLLLGELDGEQEEINLVR